MHVEYQANWDLNGLNIFDFGHAYAAKFLSLSAMFLMALVLFDLLPRLHENVISVLDPLGRLIGTTLNTKSSGFQTFLEFPFEWHIVWPCKFFQHA